jgi:citrate lyase subunit beta/citryl-CoA lyase
MITSDHVQGARSLLFVPGHRADRFSKAEQSPADIVVLDLEDAVGADRKNQARENIRAWLSAGHDAVVRINGIGTPWYEDDVQMLAGVDCVVMVPKVPNRSHVVDVASRLSARSQIMPLLETAAGILNSGEICSGPAVTRAVFGNADLARELGIDLADRIALTPARASVVLASAARGLPSPVDGVTTAVMDDSALADDAEHAVALGFGGKLCLHPRQIERVNLAFSPSTEDLQWAKEVVNAAEEHRGSVTRVRGQVVGTPIIEQARRLLAKVGQIPV